MISPEVRREMERILARENPGSAIVGFASPAVLDEESWNAIRVSALVEGELRDPLILDWTAGPYGEVRYDEGDFPVPIPLGNEVSAEVMSMNTGTSRQRMKCTVWFEDPDGYTKGSHSETFYCDPYGAIYTATPRVTINKEGTWELHALLVTA
ncbi:hypothetical protein ES703_66801 [subsurface metagenome]